jgi:predicted O-linked N-acetylglucosamine transferase (SPINDLY family)
MPASSEVSTLSPVFVEAQSRVARGDQAGAELLCRQILRAQPDDFPAVYLLGFIAAGARRHEEAAQLFTRAVALRPEEASTYNNLGNALLQLGRVQESLPCFEHALLRRPDYGEAHFNRGNALRELRRLPEALEAYDRALGLKPQLAEAHNNRGKTLQELKRLDEALASFSRALQLSPASAQTLANLGVVLGELGRLEDSLAAYERALVLAPDVAMARTNRILTLQRLNRTEDALEAQERALQLTPDSASAHFQRGVLLQQLRRLDEALVSYEASLRLEADDAQVWYHRAGLLVALERPAEADASFNRALQLQPDYADAHRDRAELNWQHGRHEAALAGYESALATAPDLPWMYGTWLHARMKLCDWVDWERHSAALRGQLDTGARPAQPFILLSLLDSPALHRRMAEELVRETCPARSSLPAPTRRQRGERIRVGYYSADYREHPVAQLTAPVFEQHDRRRFEVCAFAFGPGSDDPMRQRLRRAFDQFVEVGRRSDRDIALLSRQMGIDIAVDLTGFTAHNRLGVFAQRAAAVQVNYLGYASTIGAPFMDYLIADQVLIPPEQRPHYSEQIAYLPRCYQVNEHARQGAMRSYTRAELGLPEAGVVFCCFNNAYKITPEVFASWLRILEAVPGSVLWLAKSIDAAAANLRNTAALNGIAAERLVFAERVASLPEHLARYRAADLFLDTFPYNAHTTASDALGAGLPVLSRPGQSLPSRVAASLLHCVGLPELIAGDAQDYERRAIELALNPQKLRTLRDRVDLARATAPLFDVQRFTADLENAYVLMHERVLAGLPPMDLHP